MNRLVLIGITSISFIFIYACGGSGSDPASAVDTYLTAFREYDLEKLRTIMPAEQIESASTFLSKKPSEATISIHKQFFGDELQTWNVTEVTMQGEDAASVVVDTSSRPGLAITYNFVCIKEEGQWKVDIAQAPYCWSELQEAVK